MVTELMPSAAVWLVIGVLIEAAIIDGRSLKVPNWLTFHFAFGGLAFWSWISGWEGLGMATLGLIVGLGLLLPLHLIGGMGGGDVKLLAAVGAWVGAEITLGAFAASAVVGGLMAIGMIAVRGPSWRHHAQEFAAISKEIVTVRNPDQLSASAAIRKPKALLLPYGIPLAIGSIIYFLYIGLIF